ncbi:MAG: thiamine phosphate synthase [Paramuribaculum sp.]|nr:thiamine phosphate synthase [Paramuribaculum sp.]
MADNPIRIAITGQQPFDNESQRLTKLLDSGWTYIHLRYPELTLREVRNIIERIPQHYHSQLKLHGHFELINEFNIGGLHLNRRCPVPPANYSGVLSRSCHSVDEVAESAATGKYAYVTLSPVFLSLSKQGYTPSIDMDGFKLAAEMMPVIALGGIAPHKIPDMAFIPLAGYAVLGYLSNIHDLNELESISKDFIKYEQH